MSQKDRREWEAMLDADAKLRPAWNGFTEQLAKDADLIKQAILPTGQAIGTAARAVHVAAGTDRDADYHRDKGLPFAQGEQPSTNLDM